MLASDNVLLKKETKALFRLNGGEPGGLPSVGSHRVDTTEVT